MTIDEFVKLKKGEPVRYRMQDGSWADCRVRSIHGVKEFRSLFLTADGFPSLFFVNTKEADRVERLTHRATTAPAGDQEDLFAS